MSGEIYQRHQKLKRTGKPKIVYVHWTCLTFCFFRELCSEIDYSYQTKSAYSDDVFTPDVALFIDSSSSGEYMLKRIEPLSPTFHDDSAFKRVQTENEYTVKYEDGVPTIEIID